MDTIEDIVRTHVPLIHSPSAKGWNSVFCETCGDGTHSKGPRGGWLFENEMCFYNCFNCSIDGNFDPNRDSPHSKNMYDIFRSFGVPIKDIQALIASKIKTEKGKVLKRQPRVHLPNLPVPDFFKPMTEFDDDDILAEEARDFLWEKYKITQNDYQFFLSTGKTSSTYSIDVHLCRSLRPRIIIPSYYNGRMIYWQARLFVGESIKKYITVSVEDSQSLMFGMDNLYVNDSESPLYITEGFFDSWHVNGVAILANAMKRGKILLLDRSRRDKVVIPDYNKDGMNLAQQAVELGWGVSLPEILPCTDICKAINKFGKLYVLKTIVDKTYYDFEAKLRLKEFMLENYNFLQ